MLLYHYTTLDVLALIIKYKTLRFNWLINVDDQDESETSDYRSFKEHIFASCWTNDVVKNISLFVLPILKEGINHGYCEK